MFYGVCVWLTGLPCSGKTTTMNNLLDKLFDREDHVPSPGRGLELTTSTLDGDDVREWFPGLGFSKEDRDLHVKRMGWIASKIVHHRGFVIVSLVSPYKEARDWCRDLIEDRGHFVEVYMDVPLATCEERDVKGMYKKAREGTITNFTGIDDPYEPPINPEIRVTEGQDGAQMIMEYLENEFLI